jgi:CubicO group peptidase (beta-lactamase class C family)
MYIKRLILLILLSAQSLSAESSTIPSNKLGTQITKQLDLQLSKNSERYGIVGQAVRILKNNQVVYDGRNGFSNIELAVPVSDKHRFPSYSVTKLFTSVLLMQLVERGDVELHQSIRKYLPSLPEHWQDVTIKHALSHTSGVPRYMDQVIATDKFLLTKQAVFSSLSEQPEHFKIGSKNSYNNTNFLILSAVLETITNKSYSELVQEIIIKPLNLTNTGHVSAKAVIKNMVSSYASANGELVKNRILDWPEYSYAHSALYSTPADLTTFMTALVTGKFVKKSSLTNLWQPMKLNNGKNGRYAFGFEYKIKDGYKQVGHDGGNRVKLRHYFNEELQDNYTIAYMTNGNTQDVWTDILADSLMAIIDKKQFVLANLSQQFMTYALANDTDKLNLLYKELSKTLKGDSAAIERFIVEYSYGIRYSVGAKESITAFKFYTQKFPLSANAWDSLAETWQALANKKKAIMYYKKVLTIAPNSINAKKHLKKLMMD